MQALESAMPVPIRPGEHGPVHDAVVSAVVLPYRPGGHGLQAEAPLRLYVPTEHTAAVADVDPAKQAYPAVQGPVHALELATALPYRPPGHGPEQLLDVNACAAPNVPKGHGVHCTAPLRL